MRGLLFVTTWVVGGVEEPRVPAMLASNPCQPPGAAPGVHACHRGEAAQPSESSAGQRRTDCTPDPGMVDPGVSRARRGVPQRACVGPGSPETGPLHSSKGTLMSTDLTTFPVPEGPGSVTSAPNLPAGFTDTFTSRIIETGGHRQHAVVGGEGPPLLLVHGWPESWYAWRLRDAHAGAAASPSSRWTSAAWG